MTKQEVIATMCELCSIVGREKFDSRFPHDCFCGENPFKIGDFKFSREVIDFIREAISEKLNGTRNLND
mgnify:FL=1